MTANSPPLQRTPSVARVWLKPRKALPFYGRHPWVRTSAIGRIESMVPVPESVNEQDPSRYDGAMVDLVNEKGRFIARGFFNSKSHIPIRLFSWQEEENLDADFFRRRLQSAINLRTELGYQSALQKAAKGETPATEGNSAARLVFSEADFLSGLIVDRFGEFLVVQATSLAMWQRIEMIASLLQELLQPRGIILRSERSAAKWEGFESEEDRTWGELPTGPLEIIENGLKFQVDLREGQKTGFYLDQRENRQAATRHFVGKNVLDAFCYTGGFALNAARAGAASVLGVDSSKRAIQTARENAQKNSLTNVQFEEADCFQTLESLRDEGRKFGGIVLDPPKFAPSRSRVAQALQAYHRINRLAVDLLESGGILVTCSCSGSVLRDDFLMMLSGVAQKAGRDLQILEQRGAAPDHPVAATCLESEYLKCVTLRVA